MGRPQTPGEIIGIIARWGRIERQHSATIGHWKAFTIAALIAAAWFSAGYHIGSSRPCGMEIRDNHFEVNR